MTVNLGPVEREGSRPTLLHRLKPCPSLCRHDPLVDRHFTYDDASTAASVLGLQCTEGNTRRLERGVKGAFRAMPVY
jgi:hypothetical protein